MTFVYIIIFLALTFLALLAIILFSLRKLFNSSNSVSENVKISIVTAAKNESENIPSLISSLEKQNYPAEYFEVIVVDDNSSDNTFDITKNLIKDKPNFRIIQAHDKKFEGKKGALDLGIKAASNPFILITDADCKPQSNWLKSFADKFAHNYDFIFGIAPFYLDKSLAGKISCFENLRTAILTFSAANLGLPYSAAARSFGFKKESFENLNGYSNTIETLSGDDDLLLREAVKHKMKIGMVTNQDAFVYSEPKSKFGNYIKQKARHTSTSFHYLFKHRLMLGLWHTINLLFLFSPLLMFINSVFIFLLLFKLAVDFILVSLSQKKFGYNFKLYEIIYLQIFYELFIVINFFTAKLMKVEWK